MTLKQIEQINKEAYPDHEKRSERHALILVAFVSIITCVILVNLYGYYN